MDQHSKRWRTLTVLALLVFVAVGIWTSPDYGISWDYEAHDSYGKWIADWYQNPSENHEAVQHGMRCYGPFFEIWVNIGRWLFFWVDEVTVKSATTCLFGAFGALAAYVITSTIYSRRAGFLATVMLLLTPMYYGHSFINHKDLPLAVTHAWVLAALVVSLKPASPRIKTCALVGLALGICLAIRMGAILVVAPIAIGWAGVTFSNGSNLQFKFREIVKNTSIFVMQLLIAWATMLLLWPYAMLHPIDAPRHVLIRSSSYPWSHAVLFEGQHIAAPSVSRRYMFVWFEQTLPEFILIGIALGLCVAAWHILKNPRILLTRQATMIAVLISSIAIPIGIIICMRSVIYDAVRHLLFVVPPLIVLVALAYNFILEKVASRARIILATALGLAFIHGATQLASLHPFEYVYFNKMIGGGLPKAYGKFETEYWATCLKQSVEWLRENLGEQQNIKISGWSDPLQITWYSNKPSSKGPKFQYVSTEAEADIYLTTSRWNGHLKPYRLLHTIDRQGVPLCFIFDRRLPSQ